MSYTLIDNDTGKDIVETLNNQKEEIDRLQNIIKEVRDILEPLIALEGTMTTKGMKKLLEILDKEK